MSFNDNWMTYEEFIKTHGKNEYFTAPFAIKNVTYKSGRQKYIVCDAMNNPYDAMKLTNIFTGKKRFYVSRK